MMQRIKQLYLSFPVQLLLLHLRTNLLLLILYVLLVMMMSGVIGRRLGIQYLFLDPEYLGQVGFYSFFMVGVAFGGFVMSWNLTTYLLTAHHFPFLASLGRPFTKFCINNALLPLLLLLYLVSIVIYFQLGYEELPGLTVAINVTGLLSGIISLIATYSFYFQLTNRDISYYDSGEGEPVAEAPAASFAPGYRQVDLDYIKRDQNRLQVRTYLTEHLRYRLVRSVAHYDSALLMNIFRQNHLNALLLQLLSMLALLVLGYLVEYSFFRIPAGASILILFSLIVAAIGAITYWFNEWRLFIFVLLLLGINYVTSFSFFERQGRAYGLDYQAPPAVYDYDTLQAVCLSDQVERDKAATRAILNRWKGRVAPDTRPKMVIITASGGGLRSATWTMQVIQTADSLLQGQLLDHTTLITGASGGMIGMAYLRELYLQQQQRPEVNLYAAEHIDRISEDMLNSIAFTMVSNDMFLPWVQFEHSGQQFYMDRGYRFERQLSENTDGLFDKRLADYRQPEREALVPMLYLTPSIVNDGRRLTISPQGVTFMMSPPIGHREKGAVEVDAVDFGWLFRNHEADSLSFLSGLRMNATYPYVLPLVQLPTVPVIQTVDAGFRDNYGILSAARFIQVFRNWILENTSGVVLLHLSTSEKIERIESAEGRGMIESIIDPLGMAGKVLTVQEFEHDNAIGFVYDLLGEDHFEVIRFLYRPFEESRLEAAVSFHLTNHEREDVLQAIHLPDNQESLHRLVEVLGGTMAEK